MNELSSVFNNNGNKQIAIAISVAVGTLFVLHLFHQIRLARLQIDKTKEEIEDLRQDNNQSGRG